MTERIQKPDTGSLPDINIFFPVFINAAPSGTSTSNPLKYLYVQIHDFFPHTKIKSLKNFPKKDSISYINFGIYLELPKAMSTD